MITRNGKRRLGGTSAVKEKSAKKEREAMQSTSAAATDIEGALLLVKQYNRGSEKCCRCAIGAEKLEAILRKHQEDASGPQRACRYDGL